MINSFVALLLTIWIALFSCSGFVAAQDEQSSRPKIEVSPLETFHLLGKDGKPIPYFKITFEEFEKAFKILRGGMGVEDLEKYSIRAVEVVAKIRNLSADLEIQFNIDFKVDGQLKIPINLDHLVFPVQKKTSIVSRQNGRFFIQVDGKKGQENRFKISGKRKLLTSGDSKQLQLNLPSAAFAKIQIHEIEPEMVFKIPDSAFTNSVSPFFSNGSAVEIQGVNDQTTITWSKKSKRTVNATPARAKVQNAALINKSGVAYTSRLMITADDPIDGFRFGVPVNATNININPTTYTIESDDVSSKLWTFFYLRFPEPRKEIEDLTISWEVASSPPQTAGTAVEKLTGVDFPDFDLETGNLGISSEDRAPFGVRNEFNLNNRIVNSPDERVSFDFRSSIYSADLIRFNPSSSSDNSLTFRLDIGSGQAILTVDLSRDLLLSQPDLQLNLQNWEIDPNQLIFGALEESQGLVSFKGLSIPASRQTEKLLLNRPVDVGQENKLDLPFFTGITTPSRRITLGSNDLVEVLFDSKSNRPFKSNSDFEVERIIPGKSVDLTTTADGPLKLVLDVLRIRPNTIANQTVKLEEKRGEYVLEIEHHVDSDQAIGVLAVAFDSGLNPQLTLDDKELFTEVFELDQKSFHVVSIDPSKSVTLVSRIRVDALKSTDQYSLELPSMLIPSRPATSGETVELTGINGRSYRNLEIKNRLEIRTPPGSRVTPDSQWIQVGNDRFNGNSRFYDGYRNQRVSFSKSTRDDDDVQVEKIWCHTSLTSEFRQDRVVVRFQPKNSLISWRIPEGTRLVSCSLDGRSVLDSYSPEDNQIQVGFEDFSRDYVLVFLLRYFSQGQSPSVQLNLPKTKRLLWCRNLYWSFDLPDNEYLWTNSDNLSATFTITGTGFFLRPTPSLSRHQLERWIDADLEFDSEPARADYLFSSFGVTDGSSVYLVSKRNLVVFFGLFFSIAGYAFIWIPIMRNPFVMVTVAGGLLILGVWYPIWFVQLLQIELLVGFLICVGLAIAHLTNWFGPTVNETRIETNIPSIALAAPDSNAARSTRTHVDRDSKSEDIG